MGVGLNKLELNREALDADLDAAWEVLAEPIQTVMRRYQVPNAYEQMKDLTRGRRIDRERLKQFIESLDIPTEVKKHLIHLTPDHYTGLAGQLVKAFS